MPNARKETANFGCCGTSGKRIHRQGGGARGPGGGEGTWGQQGEAYIEDLEAGNVQDSDERGALPLGLVQGLVDAQHQPAEHALIGGLGQGLNGKVSLGGGAPGDRASDTRSP